ncbi:hypothetical protein [Streptomyces sp. ME19-01-6]|uniref:hypothetical protein n=1 Tax=Streptomyces sp. ME19-01-6 TaxID=3028686 RepID=UPI0029CA226E|nr:hypothetical protein [Streptomyces sp. ME19-01-6]
MNEPATPPVQALPGGEAELRLVLHLSWEDIARLGQEAGRLAAQLQRPVSLDEAVSHRLRGRPPAAAHAKPAPDRGQPLAAHAPAHAPAAAAPLTGRSPGEQARQAIEKINGSVQPYQGGAETTGAPPGPAPEAIPSDARGILERPTRPPSPVNGISDHGQLRGA